MRSAMLVASLVLASSPVLAADSPFAGDWAVVEIHGAPVFDATKTSFKAGADGHIGTTVGCNRIVGSPKVDGSKVTFAPMGATMMACPSPLAEIERAYLAALEGVRSWRVENGALVFVGEDGATLVKLRKEK
jgi:heat shock protein HslJ